MDVARSCTEQFFFTFRDEGEMPNDDDDDDDQLVLKLELHCWRTLAA